jgi:hypothetical protein
MVGSSGHPSPLQFHCQKQRCGRERKERKQTREIKTKKIKGEKDIAYDRWALLLS